MSASLIERVRERLATESAPLRPNVVAAAIRAESGGVLGDTEVLSNLRVLQTELTGAGILEPLLRAEGTTDVLVSAPDSVWVDDGSGLRRSAVRFDDEAAVRRLAQRLALSAGRRLDEAQPWVDGQLTGLGARRLHRAAARRAATDRGRGNVPVVAGAAARHPGPRRTRRSGRDRRGGARRRSTTSSVLGWPSSSPAERARARPRCCPPAWAPSRADERIVCVEDAPELAPRHPHLVDLVARYANVEGVGEVTVRDLVRQALRMRPDRIVVGEVRGGEVVDLLAALNTGHDGGAARCTPTVPPRCPRDWRRSRPSAGCDRSALHSQLAAAVQVVLHVEPGSRRAAQARRDRDAAARRRRVGGARHRMARRSRIRLTAWPFCAIYSSSEGRRDVRGAGPRAGSSHRTAAARGGGWCRRRAPSGRRTPCWWWRVWCSSVALAFVVPITVVVAFTIVAATLVARHRRASVERAAGRGVRRAAGSARGPRRRAARRRPPDRGLRGRRCRGRRSRRHRLRAVAARARLGADVGAGLRAVAGQSMLPAQWDRLAVCWQLAHAHGSGHRDTDARGAARHRRAGPVTRRGSAAGMAGARATAVILAGLPLLGVGLGQLIGAKPVRFLLSGGVGGWLLVVGVTLACCGSGVVRPHHRTGSDVSWAAVLLAAALLIGGRSARAGFRLDRAAAVVRRHPRPLGGAADPLAVASSLDVFAACLTSGMAVASAAAATGEFAPAAPGGRAGAGGRPAGAGRRARNRMVGLGAAGGSAVGRAAASGTTVGGVGNRVGAGRDRPGRSVPARCR